jgi:Ca2+-binding EF-hand superfamily protein
VLCCALQVFRACDQDGDGVISGSELLSLMQDARGWSELDGVMEGGSVADTLPSMLRHADTNGDGQICFDEFLALLQVIGGG